MVSPAVQGRVRGLRSFLPDDFPSRNGGVVLLNVAKDQASSFKAKRADLARSHPSGVRSHFRQMNNPLLLHIDLVPATISKRTLCDCGFFFRGGMDRIGPFGSVGIDELTAHVTVALVHEEALGVRPETGKWPSTAVLKGLLCQHELPGAYDSITDFRFRLTQGRGTQSEADQKQYGTIHAGSPSRS